MNVDLSADDVVGSGQEEDGKKGTEGDEEGLYGKSKGKGFSQDGKDLLSSFPPGFGSDWQSSGKGSMQMFGPSFNGVVPPFPTDKDPSIKDVMTKLNDMSSNMDAKFFMLQQQLHHLYASYMMQDMPKS